MTSDSITNYRFDPKEALEVTPMFWVNTASKFVGIDMEAEVPTLPLYIVHC